MHHLKYLFIFIFVLTAGCSGAGSSGIGDSVGVDEAGTAYTSTGSAQLDLRSSDPSDIDWFTVTITAADMTIISQTFTMTDDVEAVIYNIPAGLNRVFAVSAYDADDALIFQGSATANVTENTTVVVTIALQDVGTSEEDVGSAEITVTYNLLPRIDYATATTNDVDTEGFVGLTVTASDPNGDTLTYAWSADGGVFSSTTATSTTWTAPSSAGTCTITILVADGHGGTASLDMEMTVH